MKKTVIIVVILLLLAGAGWFVYQKFSSKASPTQPFVPLVLVNSTEKVYTYATSPDQEIPPGYKVVGNVNDFNEQQFDQLVSGLTYLGLAPAASADVPEPGTSQKSPWDAAVATLLPAQLDLCRKMTQSDLSFYCLVRHLILNALVNKQGTDACAPIYVQAYHNQCVQIIQNQSFNLVPDTNQNGLVDLYEDIVSGSGPTYQ